MKQRGFSHNLYHQFIYCAELDSLTHDTIPKKQTQGNNNLHIYLNFSHRKRNIIKHIRSKQINK